jgi:hypothetical protein
MMNNKFVLPHDPLTPLDPHSKPTPRAIRLLRSELYANVTAIASELGGGEHGHLGMLMPAAEYIAISNGGVPYDIPVRPPMPVFQGTAAVIATTQANYERETATYTTHRDLSTHIKQLILTAVPKIYLDALSHPDFGYANVSPRQLLTHLVTTCGQITTMDLRDNLQRIKSPWNPDLPIETVFSNGTFCRRFAAEGGDPISDPAYVRILVDIFDASGVLPKAVEDWEHKPQADQTVDNAVTHFTRSNTYRMTREAKTTKTVLEANQATAKGPDNKPLVYDDSGMEGWFYCHSHGICKHHRLACPAPKAGHNNAAVMSNRMGGLNNLKSNRRPRPNNRNTDNSSTPPQEST